GIDNFNRRSTVSLSGGFGEVRLGRDYTPTFWNDTVFDPFGTSGVGTNVINSVSNNVNGNAGASPNGLTGDNYVRTSNSIGYFLPPNLGGFYGQVQYALHENTKQDWIQGSPTKKGRYVGGRFGYANGPLDVAISYGQDTKDGGGASGFWSANDVDGDPIAWKKNKVNTLNLGASYDFGPVKLFGELSQVKQKVSTDATYEYNGVVFPTTVGTSDKYNGYLVGVTVPVGAGLIRAAYSRVKAKSGNYGFQTYTLEDLLFGGNNNTSASASKFAVGYVHNLSKRTALYATVSRISLKDAQNNAAIAANTGVAYAPPSTLGGLYVPKSATGYDFGIRHSF
ncbi:MAG: porin, partial [Proteobacteria bacterium]|nr:porin [Pseudomonadota bacterium]